MATTTMRQRATTRRQHTNARHAPRSRRPSSRTATARSRVSAPPRAKAQVQGLLDRLSQALTRGDGETCAECFEDPAIMVMADGNQLLDDRDEVVSFFGEAFKQYNEQGIFDTYAEIEAIDWLTPELAVVQTHWPYLDEDAKDTGEGETSAYVVRLRPRGQAVIAAAVTLGKDSEQTTKPRAGRKTASVKRRG